MAGLSRSSLRGFHHSRVDRLLSDRARAIRELAESVERADAALFQDIGTRAGDERALLVAARRGVRQGDLSRRVAQRAVPLMSEGATAAFGSWTAAQERVRDLDARLDDALVAAEGEDLRHLRGLCLDRRFHAGLRATSRDLADTARRWATGQTGAPQRKRLLRLTRMAARAGAKTSPFSSWMITVPARWGRLGAEVTGERLLAELDGAVAGVLTQALHAALPEAAGPEVRVNPSLVRVGGGWLFIRAGQREQTVRVAAHPAIDELLRTLVPRDTEAALAARVPAGAGLVGKCLAAGLLERCIPVADHHPRPWAAWAALADAHGTADLSAGLAALDTALRDADAAGAQAAAGQLGRRLGVTLPPVEVREMSVAADWPYELPARPEGSALDELDCARRLLALQDVKFPAKLAAAEHLARTFGADYDVPLTVALDSLARARLDTDDDLGRIVGPTAPPWGADLAACVGSGVREFAGALSRLTGEVLSLAAKGPLAVQDVRRLLDDFPFAHPNRSATFYLQEASEAGIRRVVNVVHGGHGRGRGRLAAQAGIAVADLVTAADEDIVEIGGLLGSALNARAATAPRELQYPGATTGRPREQRLPMSSVRVVPGAHGLPALRDEDGRDVRLVHLGMAADLALPPFARLLEQVFGSAYLIHPSIAAFTPTAPGRAGAQPATPRVMLGTTVLQRERRLLRREEFPGAGEPRASLRAWHQWLAAYGLGSRFYLRAWSSADHGGGQSKARKPVFVDITSPLLFADAEKMLRQAEYAIVEECLPDPLAGSGHVSEYAVEVGVRR
ncbi:lanthionine biosynthesis protein lanB [Streptomyces sp. NL15-2K]|nr:lanthionine biosynthesis protein lanB [Streptomyces sp. NL15-2K]